ncbi:hypothetical protein DFH06DRAFT_1146711 [Mycena polygramma]|nr:hypothetical protein DFH06DRAFT_1146711 [Mycena polygramma]
MPPEHIRHTSRLMDLIYGPGFGTEVKSFLQEFGKFNLAIRQRYRAWMEATAIKNYAPDERVHYTVHIISLSFKSSNWRMHPPPYSGRSDQKSRTRTAPVLWSRTESYGNLYGGNRAGGVTKNLGYGVATAAELGVTLLILGNTGGHVPVASIGQKGNGSVASFGGQSEIENNVFKIATMPSAQSQQPAKGIPQELDTRFKHLSKLLKHLPTSLPDDLPNDESTYHFYLDPEDVKEEGEMYAFNRRLEVAFETHKLRDAKLLFRERGKRLGELEMFLKKNIKSNRSTDARGHQTRWIERLVQAAQDSGAKIPAKRRAANDSDDDTNGDISQSINPRPKKVQKQSLTVDLTQDSDEDSPPVTAHSFPRVPPSADAAPRPTTTTEPQREDRPATAPAPSAAAPLPKPTNVAPRAEPQQRTLFQFGAKKLSPAEAEAQRRRHAAEAKEKMRAAEQREKDNKVRALERKRDANRERQQRFRDRKKASGEGVAKKAKSAVLGTARRTVSADLNVAEVSRPGGQKWKAKRTGRKNGVIQKRHQRVNWYHPFLWPRIDAIAPRVGWSPTMIVSALQRQDPQLYGRLNKGTVQKWISKSGKKPADVGLNRVYKHHVKQAYLDWMVDAHAAQVKKGLTVEQVKFTTSLPVLRDASVKPIVDLYEWAQTPAGRDVIKRAWEKCTVGEFNLGAECLTSKKTKAAYREYLKTHPDFRKEIEDKIGDVLGLDDDTVAAAAEIEAREVAAMGDDDVFTDDMTTDPTDIPLQSVVQASLQLEISADQLPTAGRFCVPPETVSANDGGALVGNGDIENIWAYNDNGRPWSEGNLADETFAVL